MKIHITTSKFHTETYYNISKLGVEPRKLGNSSGQNLVVEYVQIFKNHELKLYYSVCANVYPKARNLVMVCIYISKVGT